MNKILFFTIFIFSAHSALYPLFSRNISENKKQLKSIYYENIHHQPSDQLKIPKKIHQIWLGGALPSTYHELCDSWRRMHPEWEYFLWTDNEVDNFNITNKELFDSIQNQGCRSDIWRYEILYRHGGIYVDIDFECLKPFDELHHTYDFYASILGGEYISNGIIGCKPYHPIMESCIRKVTKPLNERNYDTILSATGPEFFTHIILEYYNADQSNLMIFPEYYFFPFPAPLRYEIHTKRISKKEVRTYAHPNSFALHYWANSWQEQNWHTTK